MNTWNVKPIEILFIALIGFGIYLRFLWSADFTYSVFIDRDLLRGYNLWADFQYLGAESTYHLARTPGGFIAYFFNFVQFFNPSAAFIHNVVVLMDVLAIIAIPILFSKFIGRLPALFIAALYGGSLVILEELWKFWNPSITPLFSILIYWQVLNYLIDKKRWSLPIAFLLIGIAAQFHIVFLILLPLVSVMVIIVNPRTSAVIWISSIGLFVLSFFPYIVLDGLNGFSNTLYISLGSSLKTAKSIMDVDKHLLAAFRITGGRSFPFHTLPELIASSKIMYWGALFVFNIGLVSLIVFLPFLVKSLISKKSYQSDVNMRVIFVLIIFIVGAIFIAAQNVNNVQGRYHLPFLFPALLLLGFSFKSFLKWSNQTKKRTIPIIVLVAIVVPMITKDAAIAYYYTTSSRETNSSYAVKKLIVDILRSEFGWSNNEIDFDIALWLESSGKGRLSLMKPWQTFTDDENSALSYIARISTAKQNVEKFNGCALVQMPERRGTPLKPLDEKLVKSAMPHPKGFTIEKIIEREDIRVIGYRHDAPNCVRSFGNAYWMTDMEKLADKSSEGLKPLQARDLGWKEKTHLAVAVLPNKSPIIVEISFSDHKTEVVLHANALRGHARSFRITRAKMHDFELIMTPLDGGPAVQFKGGNSIGEKGLYTPWIIRGPSLPKGQYIVDLKFGGFENKNFFIQKYELTGPYAIRLTDELAWN